MEILIWFVLGFGLAHIFQVTTKRWALWDKKTGWQFHHSLFGLASILIALFLPDLRWELIGFGLGIIFEHTLKCGFVFIKRW
jgi:hypothetical protein